MLIVQKHKSQPAGILRQCGIYVPEKIVQYADIVMSDERILNPRYGVNLARELQNKELFDFAEAKREDGTYLMESELTDDELKKYDKKLKKFSLFDFVKQREEQIKEGMQDISKGIYKFKDGKQDKYICIVDHHIYSGAMIAYSMGCDYYVSIADKQADFVKTKNNLYESTTSQPKATFSITANPKKDEGKLPESILKWCEQLKDNKDDKFKMITVGNIGKKLKPFIKPTKDMAVFGGPKTPNLFVTFKSEEAKDLLVESIRNRICQELGASKLSADKVITLLQESSQSYKQSAKDLLSEIIKDLQCGQSDVQQAGEELLNLTAERSGKKDEHIHSN